MKQLISLTLLFITCSIVIAEPSQEAWNAYLSGDFAVVESIVRDLANDPDLSSEQRALLYLSLGCSDAMRLRTASAIVSFEKTLELDPSLKFSSADLPPPVWKIFQPVQERIEHNRIMETAVMDSLINVITSVKTDSIKQLIRVNRSKESILKSFLYPGFGHIDENRKKGYILAGIETIAITGWIYTGIKAKSAREDYLSLRTAEEIGTSYDKYNNYHRISWGFGVVSIATYLLSQVDYFFIPPPVTLGASLNSQNNPVFCLSFEL